MALKHLAVYLNDHLAGSDAAIELLGNLAAAYAGTDHEKLAIELKAEVEADQQELKKLIASLNISQTVVRRASAWVAEKAAQLKLRVDDPSSGPLRLQESVEAISLGVEGKRLLWRALSEASDVEPALRVLDYLRLIKRAEDQRERLETVRLEAARAALSASK